MGQNIPDDRMITLHKWVGIDGCAALLLVLADNQCCWRKIMASESNTNQRRRVSRSRNRWH